MTVDVDMSDELMEKIVAFIDREAGRDAPLTSENEAMVRDLLKRDPSVQALADELRATNAGLDTLLDDVAAVEVPDHLVALIRAHGAGNVLTPPSNPAVVSGPPIVAADGNIVDLRQPSAPGFRFGYGTFAAAASIALLIGAGVLLNLYTTFQDDRRVLQTELAAASHAVDTRDQELAVRGAELKRLAGLLDQTSEERLATERQLVENEDAIQRLQIEQASLQSRYQTLQNGHERLGELADQQAAQVANAETALDQAAAELADARQGLDVERAQVEDLSRKVAGRQKLLAELSDQLETAQKQAATASTNLADARAGQAALQDRLAAIEQDNQTLAAARDAAEQAVSGARNAQDKAVQQVVSLEAELAASKSWLVQISNYHRVYASTPKRHLVEVGAEERDHIEQWLGGMLKRSIPVPDLSDFDVTFVGARLLGVNDQPVAQLVYLDPNGQPLALCIIPAAGGAKDQTLSTNQDLNLVDWQDGQYGYAIVGWSDPRLLKSLAEAVQPIYDL